MAKNSFVIGLSITGAIVGVGFASGREIAKFFASHGFWSLFFCLLAGIFFGLFSLAIFIISKKECALIDEDFAHEKRKMANKNVKNAISSPKKSCFNYFNKVFDFVLFVCQIAIASAMFAGFSLLVDFFDFSSFSLLIVKVLVLIVCFFFLKHNDNGVGLVNMILSFVLFFLAALILVLCFSKGEYDIFPKTYSSKLLYLPLLYVGMNIFTVYPLLRERGRKISSKKELVLSSFFIGLFVFVALFMMCLCILLFGGSLIDSGFVMVELVDAKSKVFGFLYLIVVLFSIATTLISTSYGASCYLRKKMSSSGAVMVSLCLAFLISFVGFKDIIDKLYPLLGAICLVIVFLKFCFLKSNNSVFGEQ